MKSYKQLSEEIKISESKEAEELLHYGNNNDKLVRTSIDPTLKVLKKLSSEGKYSAKIAISKYWSKVADKIKNSFLKDIGEDPKDWKKYFTTGDIKNLASSLEVFWSKEMKFQTEEIILESVSECKLYRSDDESCRTGCKKTTAGVIAKGNHCPWEGKPEEEKADCHCYR